MVSDTILHGRGESGFGRRIPEDGSTARGSNGAVRLTDDLRMEAVLARDRAFDGRFLFGVVTTGIYCLPSCSARRPRRRNVRFFEDERSARSAGLRPCKRCRPDVFLAGGDPELELAEGLGRRVRAEPAAFEDVRALAAEAGVGTTRLGELTRRHFHRTPADLLETARVDHARRALLAGEGRPLDVALDAGFESSSTFHAAFKRRTGQTPAAFRRIGETRAFRIELPAGFRNEYALRMFGRDRESPDERLDGRTFSKAMWIEGAPLVLSIRLGARRADCAVESRRKLSPTALDGAQRAALRLLGLETDPGPFERRARRTPAGRRLVESRAGLRISAVPDAFETLTWAILGQQVNLAFAFVVRARLLELCGRRLPGGLTAHPRPADVARLEPPELRPLQVSGRKAEYLIGVARAIEAGEIETEALRRGSFVRAERELLARRGLGPWSVHYVLMRGLGFADCVPAGDSALALALQRFHDLPERPDPDAQRALMEPWAPWRSLACFHLWGSLTDLS
jgi:AraC family transcriptional regulator of adaptative response / DNA-3-methyladenine glycosylase II